MLVLLFSALRKLVFHCTPTKDSFPPLHLVLVNVLGKLENVQRAQSGSDCSKEIKLNEILEW